MAIKFQYYLIAFVFILVQFGLLFSEYYYVAPLVPVALGGLFFLYRWPEYGLLFFVFVIPFEGVFQGNSFLTGAKLIGMALILVVFLQVLFRKIPLHRLKTPLLYPVLALVFFSILSSIFSDNPGPALQYLRQLFTAIAVFFIALLIGPRLNLLYFARAIVFSVALTAVIALGMSQATPDGRAVGLLFDPNYYALLLICAVPLTLYLLFHEALLLYRLGWFFTLVVLMVAFEKTMSRSGLLILVATTGILALNYVYVLKKMTLSQLCLSGLAGMLVCVLGVSMLPDDYRDRIFSLTAIASGVNALEDRSLSRRSSYIIVGLEAFKKHPMLGAGPGSFAIKYAESGYSTAYVLSKTNVDIFRRAHNTYLEILAENGLTGIFCLVLVIALGLRQYWKARKYALANVGHKEALLISHYGVSFLAVALFFLFLSVLINKYFWIYLGLGCSFPYILYSSPLEQKCNSVEG